MQNYTIISQDPKTNEFWSIHKTGCSDIKKSRMMGAAAINKIEAETLADAITEWYDDELLEMGYQPGDDMHVYGCAKH